jgi:hypothetical protein
MNLASPVSHVSLYETHDRSCVQFIVCVFLLRSARVCPAVRIFNFISAAVSLLSSLLQVVRASLPQLSADLASVLPRILVFVLYQVGFKNFVYYFRCPVKVFNFFTCILFVFTSDPIPKIFKTIDLFKNFIVYTNFITIGNVRQYDACYHGNSVGEARTAEFMHFVRREGGATRRREKPNKTKEFGISRRQKLNRPLLFKEQWYFLCATAACLSTHV